MRKNVLGLFVALCAALCLPLFAQSPNAVLASAYPSDEVKFSMESAETFLVSAKNLREVKIVETNGKEVYAWKGRKDKHYNQLTMDVQYLPQKTYLVNVRYGTKWYSRSMRFDARTR